jgi:hypothetical protein
MLLGLVQKRPVKFLIELFATLSVMLAFCAGACAQTWNWTVEDVGAGESNPQQTSIIADKDGNLHLSYNSQGTLQYAFRSAADSRWYRMTLDSQIGSLSTTIALDSKGNPGICYTPGKLKYAHWDGQKWNVQQVDPGSGLIAYHCSIRYTVDDRPEISWYLESSFVLRYASLEDGVWKVRTVEAGTESGKWNSLFIDQNGLPHIAYSSFKLGELKYAYFNGKDWIRAALDTPDYNGGPHGLGPSLILDAGGNPRISYQDLYSLKYMHFDGNKWVKEVIENLPPMLQYGWRTFCSAQVLDHTANPHISYESYLGLKHAWWNGGKWHTQLIKAPAGLWFFESSMTIDKNDNLYISFKDPADGALKVAVGKPGPAVQTADSVPKNETKP